MDLTSAITSLQIAKIDAAVQMRVARKILDIQQYEGSAAVKLIEAASAGINKAGDALAAQATGLGGLVDTFG